MDAILELAVPWGYVLIAFLAAAESSVFAGVVIPGEAVMLIGGVLVYQGHADLRWMLVAACFGAIAGDSAGYWLGRAVGMKFERGRSVERVGRDRWERAKNYVRERRGRAVFFGRFVGFMRAVIPAIAGAAHIPYPVFLAYGVPAAVLWAGGFVLVGLAAGGSWRLVDEWAGRASLIIAVIAGTGLLLFLGARYVKRHWDDIVRRWEAWIERPYIVRVRRRYSSQISFIKRRLDPAQRFGLYLTLGIAVAISGAWAFGAILEDVVTKEELALFDAPVTNFLVDHREPFLTDVMVAIGHATNTIPVTGTALVIGALAYLRTRHRRWPVFLSITLLGTAALHNLVKVVIDRQRPPVEALVEAPGSSFPSGHAAVTAAFCAALAYFLSRRRTIRTTIWIWTAAAFVSFVVALSRVYLGVHWPTDVMAGLALGAFWTAVTAATTSVMTR